MGWLLHVCATWAPLETTSLPFLFIQGWGWIPYFYKVPPPGSAAVPHVSGWITGPNFVHYLKPFASHTRPSIQHQMDNHTVHITLEAIQFCRDNGIVMLGFSPQTSHWLQPLDRVFYVFLKTAYSQARFLCYSNRYSKNIFHCLPKRCLLSKLLVTQTVKNNQLSTALNLGQNHHPMILILQYHLLQMTLLQTSSLSLWIPTLNLWISLINFFGTLSSSSGKQKDC